MIDPHGDQDDVIRDVPEMSVEEVEKRIGGKERERRRRVATTPARIRTAPSNRRVILWRDSATILIFVVIALLGARFLLPNQNDVATASPTPEPTGSAIGTGPLDSGFNLTPVPTLGPAVDPSSALNATPTPIPVITPAPPTAPTGAAATRGNQAADVTWNAPVSNGGLEIKTYKVTSKPGGKTCSAATGVHHCTVSKLTNGVSYTFTVTATNPVGTSPPSAPTNAVVPAGVPGPPRNVAASPRDMAAVVSWTKPAVTGLTAITHYTVTGTPGGSCSTSGALTCTVPGLINGTSYTFTVTARNSVGTGLAGGPSIAVIPGTPPTAPGAPTGVSATVDDSQTTISWTPPSDGGSPITGYTVTGSPSGSCSTTATSCLITGLTNGQLYTFDVTAMNAIGTGPAGVTTVTPAPPPPTVPGAPQSLNATAGVSDVMLAWSAPASDGGASISNYEIYRGTSSGGETLLTTVGAVLSFDDTTAVTSTTYFYEVRAVNSVGSGPASNEASATPT
jgi:titin